MFRSASDLSVAGISLMAVLGFACGGGSAAPDATADAPPQPVDADTTDTADAALVVDAARVDAIPPDAAILGANCPHPQDLSPGDSDSGDTSSLPHSGTANCSLGTGGNADAVYLFDLGDTGPRDLTVAVSVDEGVADPFDVVLHARTTCGNRMSEVACIDAGFSEHLEILAQTGLVYVFVDGTTQHGSASVGAYDLTSSARDVVAMAAACDPAGIANRCQSGGRCVAGTCVADSAALACSQATTLDLSSGSAQITATTYAYAADHYQGSCGYAPAGLPEHVYTFTTTGVVDLVASTDNAATRLDTHLYLRGSTCAAAELACHDDVDTASNNLRSRLSVANLPADTYHLFVDGSSPSPGTGTYQLDVTVTAP